MVDFLLLIHIKFHLGITLCFFLFGVSTVVAVKYLTVSTLDLDYFINNFIKKIAVMGNNKHRTPVVRKESF